jgi:hypothetical protein
MPSSGMLLHKANVIPCSPILLTLMIEALRFFETSVLATAIMRNIPEYAILRSNFDYIELVLCLILEVCFQFTSCLKSTILHRSYSYGMHLISEISIYIYI